MVISIETAQNGFVVRDSADGGTNPIIIGDFNQLIGVLVQAFNVEVSPAGETLEQEDSTENSTEEPAEELEVESVEELDSNA